ncbi:MAG: RNA polymerase sigma factor [Actinomycetota bacterium]|nr:RNA polymerase sigma factor [Actinomycetota bacterium]
MQSAARAGVPSQCGFADWAAPSLLAMTRLARRLAPEADADDVVQEALARAWRKRTQFDPDRGTATTWLLAITADQARAARRRKLRRRRLIDDMAHVPDRPATQAAHDLDLERAIVRLAARQQLAVHLHYFLGLPIAEIAAVMGCASGTVKSTLHDARARLRELLGEDDER